MENAERPRWRVQLAEQRWGLAVTAAALVGLMFVHIASLRAHSTEGDGVYNWLYARSLAYDHDVSFTNDFQICGDPWGVGRNRGTGHPDNPFYLGPSLFWVPLITLARLVVPMAPTATAAMRAGCGRPITAFVFAFAPLLGVLTIYLAYRSARRFASEPAAAAAAALLGLGGALVAYAAVFPSYGHIYSAVALAAVVLLTLRAWEEPLRWGRWIAVAAAMAVVCLQRSTDIMTGLLPATAAALALWRRWGRLGGALALMGIGAAVGIVPQLLLYKYLYGGPFVVPQGRYFMHLHSPHPFLVLFGPHGGLLYTTPAAWIALVGAGLLVGRPRTPAALRWIGVAMLAVFALNVWLCASALDWHSSGTFGARRLVNVTAILTVFAAGALDPVVAWLSERPKVMIATGAALALSYPVLGVLGAALAQGRHAFSTERAATQGELYGLGPKSFWDVVDEEVGPLAVLPAAALFHLRYHLPMNQFGPATETYWHKRNHVDLTWIARWLPVNTPALAALSTGTTAAPTGLVFHDKRATVVFSAQWPYATHVQVRVKTPKPIKLRVGEGGWFRDRWYGELAFAAGDHLLELALPPKFFSSGLHQVVFEIDDPSAGAVLAGLGFDDRTVYPPPFSR